MTKCTCFNCSVDRLVESAQFKGITHSMHCKKCNVVFDGDNAFNKYEGYHSQCPGCDATDMFHDPTHERLAVKDVPAVVRGKKAPADLRGLYRTSTGHWTGEEKEFESDITRQLTPEKNNLYKPTADDYTFPDVTDEEIRSHFASMQELESKRSEPDLEESLQLDEKLGMMGMLTKGLYHLPPGKVRISSSKDALDSTNEIVRIRHEKAGHEVYISLEELARHEDKGTIELSSRRKKRQSDATSTNRG